VHLFLRGFGGLERQAEETTGAAGEVEFSFSSFWEPAAVVAVPAGDHWSVVARGPRDGDVVDCPPLPADGPLAWWHQVLGVAELAEQAGGGVRVGVIDTGVGPHPALGHVLDVGAFIDGQFDPGGGADVDSHGSHVNGIIAARPDAAGAYWGIAPGVELASARVFPPGAGANQGDIANAVDFLSMTHQADLVNLSLGSPTPSAIEQDAIRDALERGTLCVCAAANSAGPVEFPAAFPETVAVSALGLLGWGPAGTIAATRLPQDPAMFGSENLYLANFSCFGPEVTCGAPGVGIISTVPARDGLAAPYASMGGTSMASPAVVGLLARLLAADEDYHQLPRDQTRAETARSVLVRACVDIDLHQHFQGAGIPRER
jgi:subtilisin